jgi:hypothetical protein
MRSNVIKPSSQLVLDLEPGLLDRFPSLRECIAAGVYRRGLGKCAIDLDQAPGNLSVQLSADPSRRFSVDELERYMEKTGDYTPIHYLAEKFLSDRGAKQEAAQAELLEQLGKLQGLIKKAGLA